jgi:hypothetical protein
MVRFGGGESSMARRPPAARVAYLHLNQHLYAFLEQQLVRDGLSGPDYKVLHPLSEAPGGLLRARELGTEIGWDRSRLSHHLSGGDQPAWGGRIGVVSDDPGGGGSRGGVLGEAGHGRSGRRLVGSAEHDAGPVGDECLGCGEPKTPAAAGHQVDPVAQSQIHGAFCPCGQGERATADRSVPVP